MSRKHYTEMAAILAEHQGAFNAAETPAKRHEVMADITREFALMFKRDNPRFNAGKFFEAAGFPELTGSRMGLN